VLSELDGDRRRALLSALPAGGQTLVSATSRDAVPTGGPAPAQVVEVRREGTASVAETAP